MNTSRHFTIVFFKVLVSSTLVSSFTILPSSSPSTTKSSYEYAGRVQQLQLSDRGWDNGNFLDALGGGQQSIDEANAKYQQESYARAQHQDRKFQKMKDGNDERFQGLFDTDDSSNSNIGGVDAAAAANPGMPGMPMMEDDNASGGNRFRQMMQQAQQHQGTTVGAYMQSEQMQQPVQPPQQPQPVQQIQTPQPQQPIMPPPQAQVQPPQQPMMNNMNNMTPQDYYQALQAWQQAMVAFQQFSAANPQAAAQMAPPPPPPPPPVFTPPDASFVAGAAVPNQGLVPPPQPVVQQQTPPPPTTTSSFDTNNNNNDDESDIRQYLPKRAGGNNDAYEVNNSADVYFAQLKRDSMIRTEARKRGDLETANSPFSEKGVIALKDYLSDELIQKRRERLKANGGEFETSRDEMILPSHFEDGDVKDEDKSYTGVSYKERLMEAKKKRMSG